MSNILQFLLGHHPAKWAGAKIAFGAPFPAAVMIVGLAAITGAVWLLYRKTTVAAPGRLKMTLIALKSAALAVLLACLLQPMVITSMPVAQQNEVAVVVDDSRSMTIADSETGRSRGDVARDLLYGANGLMDRLRDDFQVHAFRIGTGSHSIDGPQDLTIRAPRTSLAEGLAQVARTLQGLPLAGLILISDGGDNSRQDPIRQAKILQAGDIPVFTVGVGQPAIAKDREITQVTAARTVMDESIFDVSVTVRNRGYTQQEFDIIIEDGERVVARQTVQPGKSAAARRYTLKLSAENEGSRVYTVRIPAEEDEIVADNNRRSFLVNKLRRKSDVLYIEGHPRNEYKFIRRAVDGDKNLRLVTYLKTGPHKFLRQGIESPGELADGFPQNKADLYQFEAIGLGDIPKSFFTADQLVMIREFVSERGGGFLMLGGSTALEENFADSPIADVLPVTLTRPALLPAHLRQPAGKEKFSLKLTAEGQHSALLRLGFNGAANRQPWEKMPQLQGVNVTGPAKPGAAVLAVHPTLSLGDEALPVIAVERYGRGRSMVIATASTWRWQMLLPHEDLSHERFWRQVLRWLATEAPPPVELSLDKASYGAGEPVNVQVRLSDRTYTPINDTSVWLKLTDPAGAVRDVQLEWAIDEDGIYGGTFSVAGEGVHQIEVTATLPSGEVQETSTRFLVAQPEVEFNLPDMDAALLKAMAAAGGGKFYAANQADHLVNDLNRLKKVIAVTVEQDVWDTPIVLVLLCGLFALEWLIRRRKGMS
jgi:uncharacterized membrane protein